LGEPVAIKILPPSKAKQPELLARFQRESRLALQLQHHNLARALHAGEEQGLHIIVMEYLEGELLSEVLQRQKRLEPRDAARIVYQALQGLQCLHEQAMVHRDLEPSNIMLVPSREHGNKSGLAHARVKILDLGFGLGLFEEDEKEGREFQLTTEGAVLGTPDYMAPEQARDAHSVTIRADIYSLGCVLYHALTGRPPFPDTSRVRQLVRHATETPLPLKTLVPSIPDGLQPIIDRMLAKDPGERFASPHEAALALKRFLLNKDGPGRPRKSAERGQVPKGVQVAEAAARGPGPPLAQTVPIAPPVMQALPVSTPSVVPASADVELVTAESAEHRGPWHRREWLIFAFGAGVGSGTIIAAGGMGLLISKLLQRKPAAEEPDNGR
jgi:serine/threonine protein kinase